MRLLITGASGMLGYSLMRLACSRHEVWGSYNSFPVTASGARTFPMDLADEARLRELVERRRPQAIIHTAALTDVDECEKNGARARLINAQATGWLAAIAEGLGAKLVYISTDYVFDGARGNYTETDQPSPANIYGETKLLGEGAVTACCPKALIVRTSIFGVNVQTKRGPVEYVINSLKNGQTIRRFCDQFSTPIYTADLCRLILEMLDRGLFGLFHVGGGDKVSRYEFAIALADLFSLPREKILSAGFEQPAGLARRPRDSSLSGKKVETALRTTLPKVREGLERLKADFATFQKGKELHDRRS